MKFDKLVKVAVGDLAPDVRESFVLDPIRTVEECFKLSTRAVDHLGDVRGDGGACDGMSYLDHGVLLYAPSPYSNRQNFTVAHEFAHWLIEHNDFLIGWVADQDKPERILESLCDAIAQVLLLPDDLIDSAISHPIRAAQVVELQTQSSAGLPVCAIAAATRLRSPGAIVLIDRKTMQVTSSSVHPDADKGWPTVIPWPGETVPSGHFLASMVEETHDTRHSSWRNKWGRSEDYFVDAVATERLICAVFSADDIWGLSALPYLVDHQYVVRPKGAFQCCGEWREVRGYPCPRCGQGFCPLCGNCKCTKVASTEQKCSQCFTITPAHLLTDGRCEMCA
ncbi:MAG: hypothetical protein QOH69_2428 [Actinomycetota bacterium]|jgi:Zn-dependent peptidase ImmA (M78 family)|nr:hypothetical protein [Actinomycetota bacterium]